MPDPKQPPPFKGFSPASEDEARPPADEQTTRDPAGSGGGAVFGIVVALIILIGGAFYYLSVTHDDSPVRARFSRVRKEQRSLATAIEAYYIDNNSYPAWTIDAAFAAQGVNPGAIVLGRQPTFRLRHNTAMMTLTTPVAYNTSLSSDLFFPDRGAPFRYYAVMCDPTMVGLTTDTTSMWICWSAGPDERFQIELPLLRRFARAKPHQFRDEHLAPFTYDPSNGTFSTGDIWRLKQ